jgi:subtilisin family serine protease
MTRPLKILGSRRRENVHSRITSVLGLHVVFLILSCVLPPGVSGQELSAYSLSKISSMAVLTKPNGQATVFIADGNSGIIFSHSITDETNASLSDFKPFFKSSVYKQPVGIAIYHNTLIVCDGAVPAVVTIDLLSHKLTSIIEGAPLHAPSAIAISQDGAIAVIDAAGGSVVWILPGSTVVKALDGSVAHPGIAVFYKKKLLLEDALTNTLQRLSVPDQQASNNSEHFAKIVSRSNKSRLLPLRADYPVANRLAIANGILYLSDGKDIVAMEDENAEALPVTLRDYQVQSATALVATSESLFVADSQAKQLWKLPLVVPAVVDFQVENNIPDLNRSLIDFYSYLFSKGVLSVQRVRADKDYPSMWDLLVSRGLFLPSKCCGSEQAEEKLSILLFSLNTEMFTNSSFSLAEKVRIGTQITIPKVDAKKRLGSAGVKLTNAKISSEVKSRVASAEFLKDINADYIAKMNSVLPRDVETLLNKMDLNLATPPSEDLKPGTLLTVGSSGEYQIVGSLKECGADLRVTSTPVSFPQVVGAPATALPTYKNSIASADYRTETSTVQMDVSSASLESISRPEILSFLKTPKGQACTKVIAKRKAYLVTRALQIVGVEYKLRGPKESAQSSHLWASARNTGYFKLVDNQTLATNLPFYLGFEVVKVQLPGLAPAVFGTQQTLWASFGSIDSLFRGAEEINLPVEQWSVRVNVPATDLHDEGSPLYKFAGLDVLSTEDLNSNAAGYAVFFDQAQTGIEEAQANRKKLQDEIHFEPSAVPPDLSLTIGIAEDGDSVDMQHPAFWDESMKSPWRTVDSNSEVHAVPRGDAEAEVLVPKAFQDSDHGTHVAGLIGSRNGKLGPGFASRANLLLIDTSKATRLSQAITAAINNQVYVFSFSFDVERGRASTALKKQIQEKAKDRLFVVAAGDDGDDVQNLEIAPIGWVGEGVPNIIGVAAADWDKQILGESLSEQGVKQKGSNYGTKYVQLAAPGKDIFSAVKGGGYAKASGSSQAVPQVAAAAAILVSEGVSDPLLVKQRLLYTADWYRPNFTGKLWGGGLLNVHRATWQHRSNLLWTQSERSRIKGLTLSDGGTIRIQSADTDEPDGSASVGNLTLNFQDILRITESNGTFRLVYQQNGKMKILNNAMIDGFIQCESMRSWSDDAKTFVDVPDGCKEPIPVQQIFDYVAATPKSAK